MWSELKGFIPTPLICPNSATADWGRGFRPPPLPNHSAIEAAESGRPTDDEHGDEGEFNGTRGVGLSAFQSNRSGGENLIEDTGNAGIFSGLSNVLLVHTFSN